MLLNGVVDGRSLLQQGEVKKVMDLVGVDDRKGRIWNKNDKESCASPRSLYSILPGVQSRFDQKTETGKGEVAGNQ